MRSRSFLSQPAERRRDLLQMAARQTAAGPGSAAVDRPCFGEFSPARFVARRGTPGWFVALDPRRSCRSGLGCDLGRQRNYPPPHRQSPARPRRFSPEVVQKHRHLTPDPCGAAALSFRFVSLKPTPGRPFVPSSQVCDLRPPAVLWSFSPVSP